MRRVIRFAVVPIASLLLCPALIRAADLRLIDAAKNQDHAEAVRLLKEHVDVNASSPDGATALHWAVYRDDADLTAQLLRAGANVNAANAIGVTPLALAAANGSAPLVQELLAHGATPNVAANREPPLLLAAKAGSLTAVRALLIHGAEIDAGEPLQGQTALMWAVSQRHPEVVKALVEGGANVNARSRTSRLLVNRGGAVGSSGADVPAIADVEKGGSTPILFAARQGDLECTRILLDAGADVNDVAPDGNSVLLTAAHSGHGDLARFLLDKGANPDAAGAGYTSLHVAVLTGDLELAKALLAHGANVNARLTRGTPARRTGEDLVLPQSLLDATPFFLAAKFVDLTMMTVLVDAGADTTLTLKDGTTPLMAAAGLGWPGTTNRRGIDTTANKSATDPHDDEPNTLLAVQMALLLKANVNQTNQAGETALFGAVRKGFTRVVQLLAENGASLELKNKRGQTPLTLTVPRLGGAADTPPEALRATGEVLRKLGATQ
jgi:uncharacterized protein